MLASSVTLASWLDSLPKTEVYEFILDKRGIKWDNQVFEAEVQGEESCYINIIDLERFVKILRLLLDQPILLTFSDGKLWLWQCIIN